MDGPVHAEVDGRRAPGSRVSVVSERLINSIGNPEEKLRKGLNFVFVGQYYLRFRTINTNSPTKLVVCSDDSTCEGTLKQHFH
jgi:hypothetical protein